MDFQKLKIGDRLIFIRNDGILSVRRGEEFEVIEPNSETTYPRAKAVDGPKVIMIGTFESHEVDLLSTAEDRQFAEYMEKRLAGGHS